MFAYQVENIDTHYGSDLKQWFWFRKITGILILSGKRVDNMFPNTEKTIFWK